MSHGTSSPSGTGEHPGTVQVLGLRASWSDAFIHLPAAWHPLGRSHEHDRHSPRSEVHRYWEGVAPLQSLIDRGIYSLSLVQLENLPPLMRNQSSKLEEPVLRGLSWSEPTPRSAVRSTQRLRKGQGGGPPRKVRFLGWEWGAGCWRKQPVSIPIKLWVRQAHVVFFS